MPGLANSRHAPRAHRPTRTDLPSANLIVPPAPIGGSASNIQAPRSQSTPPTASSSSTTTHAPRQTNNPPPPQPSQPPRSAPHELARYAKIIRRLQWKLPFLAQGYNQAVDRIGADPSAVSEAELMFKLDFFEYYMLIERALVHLLGVFGVDVSRGLAQSSLQQPRPEGEKEAHDKKGLAGSVWREGRQHRYHANVLAALDSEQNPLHGTLGTGEVRVQLGRAKDLRNRWKTAGDEMMDEQEQGDRSPAKRGASPEKGWRAKKIAAPLDSYRLEHMLEVIFRGFDEAFRIADARVRGSLRWADEDDMEMLEVLDWTAADDEAQWEFMVEAMDWEAV